MQDKAVQPAQGGPAADAVQPQGSGLDEQSALVETRLDGTQVLVGVFAEREAVERAINMLEAGGFDPSQVSVVAKDRATTERLAGQHAALHNEESGLAEPEAERMEGQVEADKVSGVNSGTGVGVVAGAAAGAALGMASMALPGIGPILVGGPAMAALGGAAAGAGAGAWLGSAIGLSTPTDDAERYTQNFEEGRWIVAIRTDRVDEVLGIFHNAGSLNV